MVAITKFAREEIFGAVKQMYTDVANKPEMGFHFPTGRPACEFLDYPDDRLDALPSTAVESFAGVGYPFRCNGIKPGDVVLDIGSGAGTDALLSALLTGPEGKVYGLDMTEAMQQKLLANAASMDVAHVELLKANAEEIPLQDATVDVVTSNGVLNLVPDKPKAFAEIFRVLKPGGCIQISDIVIRQSSGQLDKSKSNPRLWAECIVGAMHEEAFVEALRETGFREVKIHCTQDYFSRSSSESTRKVAEYFGARSITLSGSKPLG